MNPLSAPNPTIPPAAPISAAQPKRRHFSKDLLAVIIMLGIILLCAIAGIIRYGGMPTHLAGPPTGLRLNSISMISPDEGWIAGARPRSHPEKDRFGNADQNAFEPLILHYKGGRWTEDQLPANINPYHLDMTLSSIAMVSATEGWATGSTLLPIYSSTSVDGFTLPVLLHYRGGVWTVVDDPSVALGSIFLRSAADGWAIGSTRYPDSYGPLALRYDGTTWNEVKDPVFASLSLQTLAEAPDGEVWITAVDESIVGHDGDEPLIILHYDGSAWAREPVSLANDRLFGMAMISPDEGWGVGIDPGGTRGYHRRPVQGIIVHYHDGIWQTEKTIASLPDESYFYLSAVAMISADEGWAVGQDGVMVHYHNGVWKQVPGPTSENLSAVTFVSAQEGWAIGTQGSIVHYFNGRWTELRSM